LAAEGHVAGLLALCADRHDLPGDLHVFEGLVVAGGVGEAEVDVDLAVGQGQVLGLAGAADVDEGRLRGVADHAGVIDFLPAGLALVAPPDVGGRCVVL